MDNQINSGFNEIENDEISTKIISEFNVFLKAVPVERLNKGLRKMLFDYLFYNMDNLPIDFKDLLTDLYWLHELLDEIQGKEISTKFM